MEISVAIGAIFAAICFVVILALWYAGALARIIVSVGKPVVKNMWIAYKFYQGPYDKCGSHFDELCKLLPDIHSLGVYYDDPRKVQEDKCRYIVGAILADGMPQASSELVSMMEEHNYKIIEFPEVDFAVKAQFPFRLNMSAMIGAWRVYPALMKFIEARKLSPHPFLEIYINDVIHYMAPLSKNKEFYVPEVENVSSSNQDAQ